MAEKIEITVDEAESLEAHLELYILQEIRDLGDEYDNMTYLLNLVHIYERCKAAVEGTKDG